MTIRSTTPYTYNGDGVLIATDGITYTQDLVAPLSQILNDGATDSFYGLDRLANADGTWELHDALGSVRQTISDAGLPLSVVNYDPWGTVESGSAAPFGFTGELQQDDLVYLRARWYDPEQGRFVSRDPFASNDDIPQSLHRYTYTQNNPVNFTDPTGWYLCDSVIAQWSDYANYCTEQRNRLLTDPTYTNLLRNDMLGSLIQLFTDPALPGGTQGTSFPLAGQRTPAQERLEFVLWLTLSNDHGFGLEEHFAPEFVQTTDPNTNRHDSGFNVAFQDGGLWPDSSRQVGHFLTAVGFGYLNDPTAAACAVGHEQIGEITSSPAQQCWAGLSSIPTFYSAVGADLAGDITQRECLIHAMLPDLPEQFDSTMSPYKPDPDHGQPGHSGNSRQDLRLTIKGWGFGGLIKSEQIKTVEEARSWLSDNLR